MFRSMAWALAGSVGSITAPLASLNQLATSTAIVKFFVSLASVTGGSNLIAISASISEVGEVMGRAARVREDAGHFDADPLEVRVRRQEGARPWLVVVRLHGVQLRLHSTVGPGRDGDIHQHHLGGRVDG